MISKKNIKGKVQYYRQWREGGKLQGNYINADELESIRLLKAFMKDKNIFLQDVKTDDR